MLKKKQTPLWKVTYYRVPNKNLGQVAEMAYICSLDVAPSEMIVPRVGEQMFLYPDGPAGGVGETYTVENVKHFINSRQILIDVKQYSIPVYASPELAEYLNNKEVR